MLPDPDIRGGRTKAPATGPAAARAEGTAQRPRPAASGCSSELQAKFLLLFLEPAGVSEGSCPPEREPGPWRSGNQDADPGFRASARGSPAKVVCARHPAGPSPGAANGRAPSPDPLTASGSPMRELPASRDAGPRDPSEAEIVPLT